MKKVKKYSIQFFYAKLVRHRGSPDYLARGLAAGIFAGFIMPMGFQIIPALALAFVFRGSKMLAILGQVVTNPWTVPFIYPFQCWLGGFLVGNPFSLDDLFVKFRQIFEKPSWSGFFDLGKDIVIPFFVGGALLGILVAIPGYLIARWLVLRYRARKQARLQNKAGSEP